MKPNIITVLTLVLAALFASCNDQSDSPISGKWRVAEIVRYPFQPVHTVIKIQP